MPNQIVSHWSPTSFRNDWRPTTLNRIGKSEEYLESVIAQSPDLLGLASRRSGVRGPFRVFRQLTITTPTGRTIYPDISILAASGHVIIVEVKLSTNSELRDRAVIAQIIDYASSFAALPESSLVEIFRTDVGPVKTWGELIRTLFPAEPEIDELAEVLRERCQRGELNLVIACDRVPPGLPDVVTGVSSQQALGFELDVVEIVPFVREESLDAEIIFIPSTRLATEIVARTAVTVLYRQGDERPSTVVSTSSIEDIEKRIELAKQPANPLAREWPPDEVEEAFRKSGDVLAIRLLEFCKSQSDRGQFVAPGLTVNANMSFYLTAPRFDGSINRRCIFNCTNGWNSVALRLNAIESLGGQSVWQEIAERLKRLFGPKIDTDRKETGVSFDVLRPEIDEFEQLILWLKARLQNTPAL